MKASASRRLRVKIEEDRPAPTALCSVDRLVEVGVAHHVEDRREGLAQ